MYGIAGYGIFNAKARRRKERKDFEKGKSILVFTDWRSSADGLFP